MAQTTKVTFYGLSTCPYCRKAKEFMDAKGVKYDLTYVDQLDGEEKDAVVRKVAELNPRLSFPTIVIGEGADQTIFVGLDGAAERALEDVL